MLLTRLVVTGFIVAVVGAVLVWINERDRVETAVSDRAVLAFASLEAALGLPDPGTPDGLGDRAALRERLSRYCEQRMRLASHLTMGRFVLIRIVDSAGAEAAQCVDAAEPNLEAIATAADTRPLHPSRGDPPVPRLLHIAGIPYLNVTTPLTSLTPGTPLAWVNGVYSLTAAARTDFMWRIVRGVGFAVGVVFVTSLLLYPVILRLLRRLERLSRDLLDANLETLRVIGSAIAKRDSDTDIHNYRVTIYATRLAEALGLDEALIRILIKGAFLHDVGKIGIRDAILLKPGRLTDEEFKEMKQHVSHGLDIVKRSAWLSEAAAVVGGHHEKYDGSGYDNHSDGEKIPSLARIFAVADVFDALSSKRPYKEPIPYDRVIAMLREGRGTHFDPEILDRFFEIAPSLYETYANREDDLAARDLDVILRRYYQADLGAFL
jgi:HD-GYP domain-containing protein (c-di-GMP phosphodiesterase class II)